MIVLSLIIDVTWIVVFLYYTLRLLGFLEVSTIKLFGDIVENQDDTDTQVVKEHYEVKFRWPWRKEP